jgi:hypothetical protein
VVLICHLDVRRQNAGTARLERVYTAGGIAG